MIEATLRESDSYLVPAPRDEALLPGALRVLLPPGSVIALEATRFDSDVERSLQPYVVTPTLTIQPGTGWPKSHWLHFKASHDALQIFENLIKQIERPVLCNHLYAYSNTNLLLQWHDAFTADPIRVARRLATSIPEFCSALGVKCPPTDRH